MATLKGAILEIQAIVRGIEGIRVAPDYVPDNVNVFPFAICYPSAGTWSNDTPETKRGLHNVGIEVHVARKDMAQAVEQALDYAEAVPNALMLAMKNGTLTEIQAFGPITYAFGPLGYGATETVGWRFLVQNIKQRSEVV